MVFLRTVLAALVAFAVVPAAPVRADITFGNVPEDTAVQHEQYKKQAEDAFNAGMKARAAGDQYNAVRYLSRVVGYSKMGIDSPYPEKAFAELQTISDEGMKELHVARELVSGEDPAAGLSELKRIVRNYSGLPPAKEAGRLVAQLDADPKFKVLMRAALLNEDLKKAQALEAKATAVPPPPPTTISTPTATSATTSAAKPNVKSPETIEKERRAARLSNLIDAYDIYTRVAAQGSDTEPGKKAAEAKARLEKDAGLMAGIAAAQSERKAREWLGLAESLYKAGRADAARDYCTRILKECPQTPQAADARALLERMK
jgi:tetratricopeptide (TPR) repeat protein